MLMYVFILLIWRAEAEYRCADINETSTTFKPAADWVNGRYTAELCTIRNPNATNLKMDLSYYKSLHYCNISVPSKFRTPGHQHSVASLPIPKNVTCMHVCYSMTFDLIFSGCYSIQSTFTIGQVDSRPLDSFFLVESNLTKEHYLNNQPYVQFFNYDNEVKLIWYLGLPPNSYMITLCGNKTIWQGECNKNKMNATGNCTRNVHEQTLTCRFAVPFGCYHVWLEHVAPWASGLFNGQKYTEYEFCHNEVLAPEVSVSSARVWWACGGVLAALAAALVALTGRAQFRKCAYHKRVAEEWRNRRERLDSNPTPVVQELGRRPILLLYAREGEICEGAIRTLVPLLQQATSSPVYDIFSPRVCALASSAPHEWVRAALDAPDVRVVLVQTPALALLYRTQFEDTNTNLKLSEPLLGNRVMYAAPHFGDQLLQYALHLVALTAHSRHAYHKYYVATLSGLEVDALEQVVPFRRYELPRAAIALCRDLAPPVPGPDPPAPEPDATLLAELEFALQRFIEYAQRHPNYLTDQLFVIS